jgi:hypothetical protein
MKFGVFDRLDWGGDNLTDQYEDRLQMIEALDRHGFHAYFVAEHHRTPSGRAPPRPTSFSRQLHNAREGCGSGRYGRREHGRRVRRRHPKGQ